MKAVDEFNKSNTIDGEGTSGPGTPACSKTHKSNIIDKSNPIDRDAWSKNHKSNETDYYKSYLIPSKLKTKGMDIDKLSEE